jgi:predicted metal-dependent hydrolase
VFMEKKESWLDATVSEVEQMINQSEYIGEVSAFVKQKLLESYKNGAQAARSKRFTKKGGENRIGRYGKKEKRSDQ